MASLKHGIDWIAENDETAENDIEVVESLISVLLLADLFGKKPRQIASRVLQRRLKLGLIDSMVLSFESERTE